MVVMDQFTRRIVGFAVCSGSPDGSTVCRMLRHIIFGSAAPTYLSSDHDPLFEYHRWKANLRILGVKEVKTVPFVPLSHPFVEPLVGTARREYLDQTPDCVRSPNRGSLIRHYRGASAVMDPWRRLSAGLSAFSVARQA